MSKKGLVIIVVVSLILLFAVMIAGFVFLLNKLSPQIRNESGETIEAGAEEGIGPVFNMDTFRVNLADPGGKRYLRVTIALEVTGEEVVDELKKRIPQVKHKIHMILPSKKVEDIQSVEGKNETMNEIMTQLNALLKTGKIKHLYFTEFVIQ